MRLTTIFVVVAACSCSSPARGQSSGGTKDLDDVPQVYRYDIDGLDGHAAILTRRTVITTTQKSRVPSIDNNEKETTESATTTTDQTVRQEFHKVDETTLGVTETITSLYMAITTPDGATESYRSGSGSRSSLALEVEKRIGVKAALRFNIDARGVVLAFDASALPGTGAASAEARKGAFFELPEQAVRYQDPWKRVVRSPAPPIGTFVFDYAFKIRHVKEVEGRRRATIEVVINTELEETGGAVTGGMRVALVKQKVDPDDPNGLVRATEGKGSVLFDVDLGIVVRERVESKMMLTYNPIGGTGGLTRSRIEQDISTVSTTTLTRLELPKKKDS